MKHSRFNKAIVLLLVLSIMFNLTGCTKKIKANNLMDGVNANEVVALEDLSEQNKDVTDFALRLFKTSVAGNENTLISPLSVICALAMTANGAKGETRRQMQEVLGMDIDELNLYLYSYRKNLVQDEKTKLSLANAIWFADDPNFSVKKEFLQKNADYYNADIYKQVFSSKTCKEINNWVKQKTDGMIPEILDQVPTDAIMYLVNALAFEAEWEEVYKKYQITTGDFTKEDGSTQQVEFMYCNEYKYLEDEKATGFIKYYAGRDYAFVALLPNKGVTVNEYLQYLTGEELNKVLNNPSREEVITKIPKFETEYSVEMSLILKKMGMTDAFDAEFADFGDIGTYKDYNIIINRVLHKTFIQVGEKGTKAGAATVVEMAKATAVMNPVEPKVVYLDRPFVYMLIDTQNKIPFFIGTAMSIDK